MDKYLVPDGGKSPAPAPPRADTGEKSAAAKALRKNSSLIRKLGRLPAGTTATPLPPAPSAQVRKPPASTAIKPNYLEQLRGKESGKKKAPRLSAALKESLLAGAPSRKRQLSNSLRVEQQRQRRRRDVSDENSVPDAASADIDIAGQPACPRFRTKTEKIRAKRPLAAAAAAAAKEAGWFEVPGGVRDPRGVQATSAPARQQPPPASAPPAAEESGARKAVTKAAAKTKAAASRATAGGGQPARKGDAVLPQRKEPATSVPSRAGRMDEFFPRRVVTPLARPLSLVPVQEQTSSSSAPLRASPGGGSSELARPQEAPRCTRHGSRDNINDVGDDRDDGGGGGNSDSGDTDGGGGWNGDKYLDPWGSDEDLEEEEDDMPGKELNGGSSSTSYCRGPPPSSSAGTTTPAPPTVAAAGSAVARPAARTEIAARAAAAAERRAAAAAADKALPEAGAATGAETTDAVEAEGGVERADKGGAAAAAAAVATVAMGADADAAAAVEETQSLARSASAETPAAAEEGDGVEEEEAAPTPVAAPWPCRRRRGAACLFLSQRQRTGGLRCRGSGVGDAGRDTFRRQALSTVLSGGLRTQRLRMGCTSNSRTADGVVRGHPEAQGVQGRVAGGVTCLEFDAVGWQLAVGGEN
ncbi:unnamed protein product, partial [Hapterophycus canaliculatus]